MQVQMDGEQLDIVERLVTSPAAGTFVPIVPAPAQVDEDVLIGHIQSSGDLVEVRSRFRGHLVELVASAGQRLTTHDRIAWLRVAAPLMREDEGQLARLGDEPNCIRQKSPGGR